MIYLRKVLTKKKNEKLDNNLEKIKFENNNISKSRSNFINNSDELNHNIKSLIKGIENKDHLNITNNLNDKDSRLTEKIIKEKKTFLKYFLFKLLC